MDAALQAALQAPPEEVEFHGATVRIRHMTPNERMSLVDEFATDDGKLDTRRSIDWYWRLIRTCVVGVTDEDCDTLKDASLPRFEGLATAVLEVNGMGGDKERAKN